MTTVIQNLPGTNVRITIPPLSGNVVHAQQSRGADVEDFLLGSLQHPSVRLRREIRLKVRRSADAIVLEWPDAEVSVEAPSLAVAIERFRRRVATEFLTQVDAGTLTPAFRDALRAGRP